MQRAILIGFLSFWLPLAEAQHFPLPHFDLEMTGQEYQALRPVSIMSTSGALDPVLRMGKRNLDWLQLINSKRDSIISFSSAATQRGFPLEAPRSYNEQIVLKDFQELAERLPASMKAVLLEGADLTSEIPVGTVDEYIELGLAVDRVYQIANRWLTMQPYLWILAGRRSDDVRGFYFLGRDADRDANFAGFASLPADTQTQYRGWLEQMCLNNDGSSCKQAVGNAEAKQDLKALYESYLPRSQALWDNFFRISGQYRGAGWSGNQMTVPFREAADADHAYFLQHNIEDEWHFEDWRLSVAFGASGVEVIWQPGITPHVPGLGAGTIYMDANQPLTEYDGQWAIRHEFGHVLGFPDCYVEFYEEDSGIITSYQLDTTNLMCSRRGHLQEKHVSELRRVYGSGLEPATAGI